MKINNKFLIRFSLQLGQFANYPNSYNIDSLNFLIHSKTLIRAFWIGLLWTSISIFGFLWLSSNSNSYYKLSKQIRLRQAFVGMIRFYENYLKNTSHLLSKLNLIMVFFVLFYKIVQTTITSNIQTNGVVIDTSSLIDSKSKLFASRRHSCWLENESNYKLIKNSRKGTDLYRIFNLNVRPDAICFLEPILKDFDEIKNFDMNSAFFIMNETGLYVLFVFVSGLIRQKVIFKSSFINYELLQVHYMSSALERQLRKQLLSK